MAKKEGARNTDEAHVASIFPDICLTPIAGIPVPVPYSITSKLSLSYATVGNVKMKGKETFTMQSRTSKVTGNERGTIGGIFSGVNLGHCRPATHETSSSKSAG